MVDYKSFRGYSSQLYHKYGKTLWFNEPLGYLHLRFPPIQNRIINTLRYVELEPNNATAFSYEFGSIVRDIGSVFSSVLDKLVRNTAEAPLPNQLDIADYVKFLEEVENIELIGAQLVSPFSANFILPFENIRNKTLKPSQRLSWWKPYNNLKHSEIEHYQDGSLTNVIYGMGSLTVLYALMDRYRRAEGKLFYQIGYYEPMEQVRKAQFPK